MALTILSNDEYNLVQPNFTRNRYDLVDDKHCFILKYCFEDKIYYIPVQKRHKTLLLGIYLTPFTNDEYKNLITEIFKQFKNVKRLKIEGALNNYELNSKLSQATDYVTYLPETEEEYFQNFSSKFKYNRKREMRILHNDFEKVEVKKYINDIPKELFDEYFKFKKVTHKKNYRMSYTKYIHQYHVTSAYEFKLNDKTEAIVFLSEVENNVYVENTTYNVALNKYSLGTLLLLEMIKDCIANKKQAIYWGTNNDYKKHLATYSASTYYGYIYKNSSGLLLKNFLNSIKSWISKLK